jgi:hypothetical protein
VSALAVLCREYGIVIACDTISYNSETGIIMSVNAGKVVMAPEMGLVIGNTGVGNFSSFLRAVMGQKYSCLDEAIAGASDDFWTTFNGMIDNGQATEDAPCTAFYAGWSHARERFEAYRISAKDKEVNTAGEMSVIPAGTLAHLIGDWASRAYSPADAERFGILDETNDPVRTATAYICAARASCPALSDQVTEIDENFSVGGEVHLYLIEHSKMTTWITHRWPDMVGTRLNKDVGEAMPSWLPTDS